VIDEKANRIGADEEFVIPKREAGSPETSWRPLRRQFEVQQAAIIASEGKKVQARRRASFKKTIILSESGRFGERGYL
jgi:hypothetical protein